MLEDNAKALYCQIIISVLSIQKRLSKRHTSKNYSMIETDAGSLRLSPAYDIVCSKLLIPDEEDSALTINGKHNRIKRDDFYALTKTLGIPEKVRDAILYRMKGIVEIAHYDVPDSYLPAEDRKLVLNIVEERWDRIFS